jgi:UDP-N-acetylmuramoyl-tripeptide--D-alanyl-D-alanine ligase
MRNAAFAIAAAMVHGVDVRDAADAIATAEVTSWRMQLRTVGSWTVINDAYNSNPTSIASALRAAREIAGSRAVWAVLGPMAELGALTDDEHRRAGRLACELGYAGLIVVGGDAAAIAAGFAEGAGEHHSQTPAIRVSSLADAVDAVGTRVPPEAVIVVKASRVAGLERLVDALAATPEKAS